MCQGCQNKVVKNVAYRVDHVGSFLRPKELVEAREKFSKGELSQEELTKVEDKTITELVEKQKMTDKVIDKMTDKNKERVKLLMKYLGQNDSISNKEAQSLLSISEATARRFLNSLVKENLLVAVGEYKARKYIKK